MQVYDKLGGFSTYLKIYQYFPTGRCLCEEIEVSQFTEDQVSEIIIKMHSKYEAGCKVGCFIKRRGE